MMMMMIIVIIVVQVLREIFFFLKQWFRRHQRPLLQARLHQSGVTEMLMVREIRKSFIIGNHILCVPEGIIP